MGTNSNRGNWTDNPCFYVSIKDAGKFNVVAGPFKTHQEALDKVDIAIKVGQETDPKSWFYSWGTVKIQNGHRDGCLNNKLGI